MPEVTLATFNLENATPAELEQRRRAIVATYLGSGSNLDDMTKEHLQELAALTSALRRRTAGGAPKATKSAARAKGGKRTATLDDLEALA